MQLIFAYSVLVNLFSEQNLIIKSIKQIMLLHSIIFIREKSYFQRAMPEGNISISRVNKFSYLPYAREMNVLFHQANVLVNSAKLNLLAISMFTKLWRFVHPRKNSHIFQGKYDYSWVSKSSYLPYAGEINV
jgi:hypothetical protein